MKRLKLQRGFTLIELMVVAAIAAILTVGATAAYGKFVEKARVAKAIGDIGEIHIAVQKFLLTDGRFPGLAEIGLDTKTDPWGNPYQYLIVENSTNSGAARKDKNFVPVNTYYDIYSMGKDGATASPFTSTVGKDDIVMAGDGTYFGLAEDH